ncbi:hypothetical protein D9M70_468540 [compost metagenome]
MSDHLHDLRQHGVRADFLRFHHQAAMGVQRGADEGLTGLFHHRYGLTGQHGFIDGALALQHDPVDWNLLTWADP